MTREASQKNVAAELETAETDFYFVADTFGT
jgi:hypothetical protein